MIAFLEQLVSPLMVLISFLAVLATYIILIWPAGIASGDVLWLKDLALLLGGGVAGAAVPKAAKQLTGAAQEK